MIGERDDEFPSAPPAYTSEKYKLKIKVIVTDSAKAQYLPCEGAKPIVYVWNTYIGPKIVESEPSRHRSWTISNAKHFLFHIGTRAALKIWVASITPSDTRIETNGKPDRSLRR